MSEKNDIKTQKDIKTKKVKIPKTKAQKRLRNQRIIAGFLIFCLSVGVIGTTGVMIFAKSANKDNPVMTEENFFRKESTKVYDIEGNEIFEIGRKIIQNITYDQLPQSMIDALIAIEDSRFFDHDGVDVPRFAKAMITNGLDTLRYRRLMFSQGGSTLTMQLIKNTYFTYEDHENNETVEAASSGLDGVKRKFQELALARELEREQIISKKETIALYLNTANFGAQDNINGIQNSAEKYFDKNVEDLSLVESAFLAGVLNAPVAYSPYNSLRKAKERTATVLYQMNNHGYISDEEYKLALNVDLENLLVPVDPTTKETHPNQAYIDLVLNELPTLVKEAGEGVEAADGGMRIYTAMEPTIQDGIDKFQRREIGYMDQGADTNIQVGSVVIKNSTGEIVGVVGGYDYKGMRVWNNAADIKMQPASVVKPMLDYALAFEYLGWASTHVVVDGPYAYAGTDFLVGNYDGRYLGEITLDHAVGDSRNPTALKALSEVIEKIGIEGVVEYMQSMGFEKFDPDKFDLGFAIGGSAFDTSPLELAGSYAALLNGGNYIKPHTITRVEFTNGKEPLINSPSSVSVLSDAAAFLASRTMEKAVSGPTPGYLESLRRSYPVFGKTGTNRWTPTSAEQANVDVPANAQKNRLMVAATNEYTTSTWVGFVKHNNELKPWISDEEAQFDLTGKLSSYLLDLIEEINGPGGYMPRPSSVADITHILGTFPYQIPLPNMNPALVSSGGMIKRDYLTLVEAKPQPLAELAESKVSAVEKSGVLEITVNMTPYPDAEKLIVAEPYLDMPIPGGGSVRGTRIYDDSWVYGAVRYKTEVLVNGAIVQETMSENQTHTYALSYAPTDKIVVRSYYTYDLSTSMKSTPLESTITLKAPEPEVSIPNFVGQHVNEILNFAASNGMKPLKVNTTLTRDLASHNKIIKVAPDLGSKMTLKQLKTLDVTVDVNAFEYIIDPGTTAGQFASMFQNTFTILNNTEENKDRMITGFDFGNGPQTTFRLIDYEGLNANITLIFE